MAKKTNVIDVEPEVLEVKTKKQILNLDGQAYVNVMSKLYETLGKELQVLEKDDNELAQSIVETFKMRLEFIKEAWSDLELTKEEKAKIYEDYLDTSKAHQQYLMDKQKEKKARIDKKEKFKEIILGSTVIAVGLTAVISALGVVLKTINEIK